MKKWFLLHLLILLAYGLHAQTYKETIRGTIIDKDSRVTLPGATVVVINSNPLLGASSEADGSFHIANVPVGFQNLKVSLIGYEEQILPNVLVNAGKEVVLNIELVESVKKIQQVVVKASGNDHQPVNELSIVSTQAFTVEDTKRYAGGFDDPSRMAQTFAGVVGGADDAESQIIVRGNSPRGLMWQLEGVEIPQPNHFADNGSSSDGVSILSVQTLANSDFSTGAFPAEYGDATAGVFDLNMRNGNSEKYEFSFEGSFIGTEVTAEGPFAKGSNASFLFNYRYSTLALLDAMGLKVYKTGLPIFQDLNFKIYLPTKKAGVFSIFGIGGISDIKEQQVGNITDSTSGQLWNMDSGSDLGVIGINNNYIVNSKFYIHSSVSFAAQYIFNNRDELNKSDTMAPYRRESLWNDYAKALITFNNKFSARSSLKSGIIYTLEPYNLHGQYVDSNLNIMQPLLNFKGITHVIQGFSSWKYRITEQLKLIAGVNAMYFWLNKHYTVEPRVAIQYTLPKKQSIALAAGLHSRRESVAQYLALQRLPDGTYIQNNHYLDFTKSAQTVLSYNVLLKPHLNLKVEAYYFKQFNVPISVGDTGTFSLINLSESFASIPLVNKGTGQNYGIEVTLEKYFDRNYFILYNGSLFNATYTAGDGIQRSARFNSNYINNLAAGKEFIVGKNRNNTIGGSTHIIVGGGRRYTPVNFTASAAEGYEVIDNSQLYSKMTPIYYRIDVSFYFRRNRKKANMEFRIDIQDLTNRMNVIDYTYSKALNQYLTAVTGQLTPVLGYKVSF